MSGTGADRTIRLRVVGEARDAVKSLKDTGTALLTVDRSAKTVERGLTGVEREARQAGRAVARAGQQMRAGLADPVKVGISVDQASVAAARAHLVKEKARLQDSLGTLTTYADTSRALAQLGRVERQVRQLDRLDPTINVDVDTRGNGLDVLGQISKVAPQAAGAMSSLGAAGPYAAAGVGVVAAAVTPLVVGLGGLAAEGAVAFKVMDRFAQQSARNRRVAVVFGDQAAAMDRWADSINELVGVGKQDVAYAAAAIADLLVPQGFDRAAAADMSREIYNRGAALAQFSGVDIAQGIEAVSGALLGEREQLQGLGVAISQAQVDARVEVLRTKAEYAGLNDEQLQTVATLDLIKAKSGDAWTAWRSGPSEAAKVVNRLKAGLADLQTTAIDVFGDIFTSIAVGLGGDQVNPFTGISDWLQTHRGTIKKFILDTTAGLATLGSIGAFSFSMLLRAAQGTFQVMAVGFGSVLAVAHELLEGLAQVAEWFGKDSLAAGMRQAAGALDAERDAINGLVTGLGEAADGAWTAGEAIGKVKGQVDGLRTDKLLSIQVALEAGDIATVKAGIATLSRPQLKTFIAELEKGGVTRTEAAAIKLARARQVQFKAQADTGAAEASLNNTARPRSVWLDAKVDTSKLPPWLGGTAQVSLDPDQATPLLARSPLTRATSSRAKPIIIPVTVSGLDDAWGSMAKLSQAIRDAGKDEALRKRLEKVRDVITTTKTTVDRLTSAWADAVRRIATAVNAVDIGQAFDVHAAGVDRARSEVTRLADELADLQTKQAEQAWNPAAVIFYGGEVARVTKELAAAQSAAAASPADTLRTQLQAQLALTKQFASDLGVLERRGLSDAALDQIIAAGPEKGSQIAKALVDDKKLAAQFDAAYASARSWATRIGQNVEADMLTGIKAAVAKGNKQIADLLRDRTMRVQIRYTAPAIPAVPVAPRSVTYAPQITVTGGLMDSEGTVRALQQALSGHAERVGQLVWS